MSYFSKFQKISYNDTSMTNLTQRVAIPEKIKNNKDLFFWYSVKDYDRPENVAFDYYGDSTYSWVILLMNDIVDPFYDWPLSPSEVVEYAKNRYGQKESEYQGIHHWELGDEWYDSDPGQGAISVSNLDYENFDNEKRRLIKILYPQYIVHLDRELEFILRTGV